MYLFRNDLNNKPEIKLEVPIRKHNLCLNESTLNPFDILHDEIINDLEKVPFNRYFNPVSTELKIALANYVGNGVEADQILFGNGADEMLYYLFVAARQDSDSFAVSLAPSYFDYKTYCGSVGLDIRFLDLNKDLNFSVEDYLTLANDDHCKLAIICNPNNPTGNLIPDKKIIHILENCTKTIIIDETYFEFSGITFTDLLKEYPNLVIIRSFSKSFAAAGMRFGYMISSKENIKEINKVIPVFHSSLVLQSIANTLLKHKDVFLEHNKTVIALRNELYVILKSMKEVKVYPSHTNFLVFSIGKKTNELYEYLKEREVALRWVGAHPILTDCVRISIGSKDDHNVFLEELNRFLYKKGE